MRKRLNDMKYGEVFLGLNGHHYMFVCLADTDIYKGLQVVCDLVDDTICEWYGIEYEYEMIED